MRKICVIGGSRYFGRHLVTLLRDAGVDVTVVNRGSSAPPPGVTRLIADRADEAALRTALGSRDFDVVVDQICYSPAQAAVARRVFAGRTPRYVMTSTMEVYDPATSALLRTAESGPREPVREEQLDLRGWPVDLDLDLDPAEDYAERKRQAEAVFTREPPFDFVSVRSAHVLGGGPLDFTGRLAHYTERITAGRSIAVHADPLPTSFIHYREIAEFVYWAAASNFTGAVNACSHGELDVVELCDLIADGAGAPAPRYRPVQGAVAASPFSFDRYYAMANTRATQLGFAFSSVTDWLPQAAAEAFAVKPSAVKAGA